MPVIAVPLTWGQRWHVRLWVWRARALLVFGQRAAAMQVFARILQEQPNHLLALNSLGYEAARSGPTRDLVRALEYFERVALLEPHSSNAQFNVGYVLDELGRSAQAQRAFEAAIARDEKADRAWYGLGLVLVKLGQLEQALVAFRRNSKLQPMSPYAWYQIARIHVDLREPQRARDVITHLKGFEPKVASQLERETGIRAPGV